MLLWEFEDALVTKIVTVSDQLKSDLDNGKIQGNWTLDQLLNYFQDYDIILDPDDLYNMIQKDPLKNVLEPLEPNSDVIRFKGNTEAETGMSVDQARAVVDANAKQAMKRRM